MPKAGKGGLNAQLNRNKILIPNQYITVFVLYYASEQQKARRKVTDFDP